MTCNFDLRGHQALQMWLTCSLTSSYMCAKFHRNQGYHCDSCAISHGMTQLPDVYVRLHLTSMYIVQPVTGLQLPLQIDFIIGKIIRSRQFSSMGARREMARLQIAVADHMWVIWAQEVGL